MRRSDDDIDASLRIPLRGGDEDASGDGEEATSQAGGRRWLLTIVVAISLVGLGLLLGMRAPVDGECDRFPGNEGSPVPPPGARRIPGKLNVHIVPHTHDLLRLMISSCSFCNQNSHPEERRKWQRLSTR